jgi:hypothetical protein
MITFRIKNDIENAIQENLDAFRMEFSLEDVKTNKYLNKLKKDIKKTYNDTSQKQYMADEIEKVKMGRKMYKDIKQLNSILSWAGRILDSYQNLGHKKDLNYFM